MISTPFSLSFLTKDLFSSMNYLLTGQIRDEQDFHLKTIGHCDPWFNNMMFKFVSKSYRLVWSSAKGQKYAVGKCSKKGDEKRLKTPTLLYSFKTVRLNKQIFLANTHPPKLFFLYFLETFPYAWIPICHVCLCMCVHVCVCVQKTPCIVTLLVYMYLQVWGRPHTTVSHVHRLPAGDQGLPFETGVEQMFLFS